MPESAPRGFLGQADHHAVHVEEEELNGLSTWKVSYERKLLRPVTVWFCPDRNGLITRMLESATIPSGLHEREVLVALKEWKPGIRFPETVETTESMTPQRHRVRLLK